MKTLKYIIMALAVGSLLIVSSCKKTFYTDVNNNPNTPPTVVPYVLLSSVEGALGFTVTSTHCFYTSLLTQQTFGATRQAAAYYQYIFTTQDFDDPWSNWYTSVMENDLTLMNLADSRTDSTYGGIARMIMAYALQNVVDAWGSVPYSQAFQGLGLVNIHPTYDNDAALYGSIEALVDKGLVLLNNANKDPDKPSQHGEDVIYGGSRSAWIMFGHAIKARLYIHQSKNSAAMATKALTEVAASFASNADNARYPFGTSETAANGLYLFNEYRADMGFVGGTLSSMMAANTDPRYQSLFDSTYSDFNGVGLGGFYGNPDAVGQFITYEELMFIKAEATLRSGGTYADAQTAFQAGIDASMQKFGIPAVDETAYMTAHGTLPTTSVAAAVSAVGYEAWLSLYMNPEAFAQWRCTGAPALSPVAGSNMPRRFMIPQSELTFNTANAPSTTLYSPKLFWDN